MHNIIQLIGNKEAKKYALIRVMVTKSLDNLLS